MYSYITEFGISPQENERLERAGVTFALTPLETMNAMHYAALSDLIVEGRVRAVERYSRGIYHTKVVLDVKEVYKDCGAVPRLGRGELWLFERWPHQHSDRAVNINCLLSGPCFRTGEKVVILAGSHPLALRRLVGSALRTESMDKLRDDFGTPRELIKAASRPRADVLEIYQTYKAKWRKFLLKENALRIPQDTDVMKRKYFRERVAAIFEAQAQECRARVRRAEASDG